MHDLGGGLIRIAQGGALKRGTADALVMLFSSRAAPSYAPFDFIAFAGAIPQTVLLLRDDTARYNYHCGIAGLGAAIDDTASELGEIRRTLGARRLITLGTSQGGYGAFLFGQLLGADAIVSVNGYSYLDPAIARQRGGGERFPGSFDDMAALYADRGRAPAHLDLRPLLSAARPQPRLRWHHGTQDQTDLHQTAHLHGAPGVEFVPHPEVRSHAMLCPRLVHSGALAQEIASLAAAPEAV